MKKSQQVKSHFDLKRIFESAALNALAYIAIIAVASYALSAVLVTLGSKKFSLSYNFASAADSKYISWQTDGFYRNNCPNGTVPSVPSAGSGFVNGQGQPDPDGGSTGYYMMNNCNSGGAYSSGGFFRTNYEGQLKIRDIRVMSIDIRNDSYCGAGSPRLRFTINNSFVVHGMGCNVGRKSKVPGQPNWTRYSFTQDDIRRLNPTANNGQALNLDWVISYFGVKYDTDLTSGAMYSTRSWLDNFTLNNELTAYSDRKYNQNTKPIVTPVMMPETIVNDATQKAGFAPGVIANVSGVDMSDCTQSAPSTPLPTVLCGAKVKVGGVDAPLFSVSPTKIVFQIPKTATVGNTIVFVERNGVPSQEATVTIATSAPGVYTTNKLGTGQINAQHYSLENPPKYPYYSAITPTAPAYNNEIVILYLTGLNGSKNVTVTIAGKAAVLEYAGPSGGNVGLDQINMRLPSGLTMNTSPGLDVKVCVSNVCSNSATLPYRN